MAITVTSKKIYSDKDPTEDERIAGVEYVKNGGLAEPELVDKRIENEVLRMRLPKDEGNISITVMPGERLGQMSVNIQFEGKSGEREFCLKEQDTLLQHAADWLNDILSDFGCDFKARIESLPCPHAEARLQIDLAARRLEGAQLETAKQRVPVGGRKVKRKN
jgi:hypothetical protein